MPNNIPNPSQNVGSTNIATYPPIPYGNLNPQQQGCGYITTLINPFFTSVSYPVTTSVGQFLYYATVIPATSSIDVSDYNNHAFQAFFSSPTGSASANLYVSSSLDGLNWIGEFSFITSSLTASLTTSSIFRLSGSRRRYFRATYSGSGPTTGSLYLLSGQ
jgi:hypothetical protein